MGIIVQKFGGTSVADATKIKNVAKRIVQTHDEGHRVAVVVSAMGDSTDRLENLAYEISANPPERELAMLMSTGEQVFNRTACHGSLRTWTPCNFSHGNAGRHHDRRLL